MQVTITLTSVGATISATLDLYSNETGPWTFLANVPTATLIAGYTFTAPVGATMFQLRDLASCETVLTLVCQGLTTSTTSTTTETTTELPFQYIIPDHIWAPVEGGTYYVDIIFVDFDMNPYGVPEDPWYTVAVNPTVLLYSASPLYWYQVMTVVVSDNTGGIEKLGQLNVFEGDGTPFGFVAMRQDGSI
jgi:hypothetical protein